MKNIIFIITFFISCISRSQDCSTLIKTKTDEVTGKTSTTSIKALTITNDGKKGLIISFINGVYNGGVLVSISVIGGSKCIDENNKINILFTDSTRLELKNQNDFNCQGDTYFMLNEGDSDLLKLQTKKIKIMRIYSHDYSYVQVNFTNKNQDEFNQTINCITNKK